MEDDGNAAGGGENDGPGVIPQCVSNTKYMHSENQVVLGVLVV
jgi:hypothetical protein